MSTEQFKAFAKEHGIEMTAQAIATRPDQQDPQGEADAKWSREADHFLITLTQVPAGFKSDRAPNVIWSGYYSTGAAHPLMWARANPRAFKRAAGHWKAGDCLQRLKNYHAGWSTRLTLHESEALETVRDAYRKAAPLDIGDVLHSLQMDSYDWESTFEDWAESLGYDTDSRRALSIFEACQNTAKNLLRSLGRVNFDQFMSLEEV